MSLPPQVKKQKLAVAVSGSGRSLANLIAASQDRSWEVGAVISSNPECRANDIARQHNIPLFIASFTPANLELATIQLQTFLADFHIDWIVLAGFLKRFPSLAQWHQRIINIHPALLPKFGGKGMYGHFVHEAVLAAGEKISGATVHFVNEQYDEGDIIAHIKVDVSATDSADTLAAKVFSAECDLLVWTIDGLTLGTLPQKNHRIALYPNLS